MRAPAGAMVRLADAGTGLDVKRREFLGLAACGSAFTLAGSVGCRRFPTRSGVFSSLAVDNIGVRATPERAIELAVRYGFGGVSPDLGAVGQRSDAGRRELVKRLKDHGLRLGAAGLPLSLTDDDHFDAELRRLPRRIAALRSVGVDRIGTWIQPWHDRRPYSENFEVIAGRVSATADVVGREGMRLGLEWAGPDTFRSGRQYPFIDTMAETRRLIAQCARRNVGLVLDSWHWHTARGSVADIEALTKVDVVDVHLADAPLGVRVEDARDNHRALPFATGVIDLHGFLGALRRIGFDGPLCAEPFDDALNALDDDGACARTAAAMATALRAVRPG